MRYGVTIRSLSAHIHTHTHTLSLFLLPLALVYHLIVLEYVHIFHMWWASGLYIIHYMLAPSRYDIQYEYCAAGRQGFLFVILIRWGAFFFCTFFWRAWPEWRKEGVGCVAVFPPLGGNSTYCVEVIWLAKWDTPLFRSCHFRVLVAPLFYTLWNISDNNSQQML